MDKDMFFKTTKMNNITFKSSSASTHYTFHHFLVLNFAI